MYGNGESSTVHVAHPAVLSSFLPVRSDRLILHKRFPGKRGTLMREDFNMTRRIFVAVLALGFAAFLAPRLALAEDHLAEAIKHTKEAIEHGKAGHADVLVTHAEAALTHANAAEKEKANPHTKEGITHLDAAIAEGKKKDAASATKHAEEALTHLEAATK
jgi:Small metal-binding protein